MLSGKIDVHIDPKLTRLLERGMTEAAQEAVEDLVMAGDGMLPVYAGQEVYSKPESPRYKRKGHLNKGHKSKMGRLEGEIQIDSRIGGAKTNYSPAVNDGFTGTQKVRSHTRKGATVRAHTRQVDMPAKPFIDKTVEWVNDNASKITSRVIKKYTKL